MINPQEIIEKYSVEELNQTAEDYFKSIPDPTFQMAKPFSDFMSAPEILQNMGLLLSGLHLAQTMTVLEFAAGTCWFSRFLNQMQCQTISCDVSQTALDIGKRLFEEYPIVGTPIAEPTFLHFDGRQLNLPDESVDRIICNDGFHHVPNQEVVLAELARVLKPGGIAGFCEPGPYHSQGPQSQYEMKNYHVLENDILIEDIFALAQKHGFTDIRLKVLGDVSVSIRQYRLITQPLVRKVLNRLPGRLGHLLIQKTIFFLHKGQHMPDSRSHIGLAHNIQLPQTHFSIKAGEILTVPVRVVNTGGSKWLNENIKGIGVVRVGTHLYDAQDNLLELNHSRAEIPGPTSPSQSFEQTLQLRFPQAGTYKVAVDMVSENICWFENVGSKPEFITVEVDA